MCMLYELGDKSINVRATSEDSNSTRFNIVWDLFFD
jgi:hypothetical protein